MRAALTYSSVRQGQLGVNVVERLVLSFGWRWQQLDAVNDDGVDGLIFVEENGSPNGQIIYVQVKCHRSRVDKTGRICVTFRKAGLARSFERWRRVVGGAILVHVHPEEPHESHWVDLLSASAIFGSQVFVDGSNRFDSSCRGALRKLCGTIHRDLLKPKIDTEVEDFKYVKAASEEAQNAARAQYLKFRAHPPTLYGGGPKVSFTNEGWRHITRRGRSRLLQLQSFLLLGCLPRVIGSTPESSLEIAESTSDGHLVVARAAVTFPFRQTAMLKLMMKRRGESGAYRYSFWSVYEARRGRDVLGRR